MQLILNVHLVSQAADLICLGGDCHVEVCPVEVTGKDNIQVNYYTIFQKYLLHTNILSRY